MGYSSLEVYYKTLWQMTFHYKYSISDWENLVPWERDVLVEMTADHIRETEEKSKQMNI